MYDDQFDSGAYGYYDDSEAYLEQARKRATLHRIDAEIASKQRHDRFAAFMCLLIACGAIACVVVLGIAAFNMAQVLTR